MIIILAIKLESSVSRIFNDLRVLNNANKLVNLALLRYHFKSYPRIDFSKSLK